MLVRFLTALNKILFESESNSSMLRRFCRCKQQIVVLDRTSISYKYNHTRRYRNVNGHSSSF